MDNRHEIKEIKFDPQEQQLRYIDTRLTERNILELLQWAYKPLIDLDLKDISKISEFHNSLDQLKRNVQNYFQSWQGSDSSGGCGEAFTRLVAFGILEDFPGKTDKRIWTDQISAVSIKETDKLKLEITTTFLNEDTKEDEIYKFTFNSSLAEINVRANNLTQEIEKARKMKDEDFNNF